jgi:hypothetical protein
MSGGAERPEWAEAPEIAEEVRKAVVARMRARDARARARAAVERSRLLRAARRSLRGGGSRVSAARGARR